MKSRQFIWLLLFSTVFGLRCFANFNTNGESKSLKKVFILLRSEENPYQLEKFKQSINNDLRLQNVSAQIETYKRSEPLPQAKIFKKAYSENYDVILLIDQIAKFSIDNRVTNTMIKVGGKYKIRSYNLKKSPYTWVDHGDSNCNISVRLSIREFTKKILGTIDIESSPNFVWEDVAIADTESYNAKMLMYNKLILQLEEQRKKTIQILNDIRNLKHQLKNDQIIMSKLAELHQRQN